MARFRFQTKVAIAISALAPASPRIRNRGCPKIRYFSPANGCSTVQRRRRIASGLIEAEVTALSGGVAEAAPAAAEKATAPVAAPAVPAAPAIDPNDPHFKVAPGGYTPMQPTAGKGMPVDGNLGTQTLGPAGYVAASGTSFAAPAVAATAAAR